VTRQLHPLSPGWSRVRLSDLGFTYGGLSGKSAPDFGTGEGLYVPFTNVIQNVFLNPSNLERVRIRPGEVQNYISGGDILLNASSETPEEVGLACYVEDGLDLAGVYLNSFCFGFRVTAPKRVSPKFLAFQLRGPVGRTLMAPLAQGYTRYNLSKNRFLALEMPIAPIDEQIAIATALRDVDSLIDSLDVLIDKKHQLRVATIQSLLSGKRRLPGFEETWAVIPFLELFRRVSASGKKLPTSAFRAVGRWPVVDQSSSDIAGHTDREDLVLEAPPGGLVVFGDHTRVVKHIEGKFVVGADGVQMLAPLGEHNARFLALALRQAPIPATGYNRHFSHLVDLVFEVPEPSEQQAIAEVLSDIDAEINALVARREKTALLKQGMVQELLTGRTRLVA